MKRLGAALLLVTMAALTSGCNQERVANRGFSLPIGDAENGRSLFVKKYQCIECHTIAGTESVGEEGQLVENGNITVVLGGTSTRVQTYGDLVTSIINPSHRIAKGYPLEQVSEEGQSRMTYYNQIMTVEELVDLVTFLKSQYKFKSYPETRYRFYAYPG